MAEKEFDKDLHPEHVWVRCRGGYLRIMPPGDWIDFKGDVHYVPAAALAQRDTELRELRADKAAELERLAEEFEKRTLDIEDDIRAEQLGESDRHPKALWGEGHALHEVASHLRERAAEIRGGDGG